MQLHFPDSKITDAINFIVKENLPTELSPRLLEKIEQ